MRAVQWTAPRTMRLVEVEKPVPKPHEALVRLESCGVCGSDVHYYVEGRIGNQVLTEPTVLGHEYAGVVEAVGENADPALVGRRVAVEPGIPCMRCEWCRTGHYNICRAMYFPGGPGCDGAFCDYMAVHADFCYPIPDTVTAAEAAMLEPLAVAIHTAELARLRPGDTVGLIGLGSIGLLTAQMLKLTGAHTIYGADLLAYRAAAAARYGVDDAVDAAGQDIVARVREQTAGRGVDVAVDCSNRSEPLGQCVRMARPGGRVVLTGISGQDEDPLPVSEARRKELTLQWCRRFVHNYPAAIQLLAAKKVDVTSLITHSFPLERTQEAFDLVADAADNVLKVSIDW
ncbi:MAG: zinc-dependent alcohol dehydrogenase [Candidatus Hydrogenedentota bacterium]